MLRPSLHVFKFGTSECSDFSVCSERDVSRRSLDILQMDRFMNAKLNTNLILVDGLPGSGKSTTAQLVWLQLVRSGYDASWFFEHQSSHPIYKYDDPENTFQTSVSESNRIHEEA